MSEGTINQASHAQKSRLTMIENTEKIAQMFDSDGDEELKNGDRGFGDLASKVNNQP